MAPFPDYGPNQVVSISSGSIKINGKPIDAGRFFPDDRSLRVSADGKATVRVRNLGGFLLFGPAELYLAGGKRPRAKLLRGAALVERTAGNSFTFTTNGYRLSSSSGVFFAEARGPSETYVCACDGPLEVTNADWPSDNTKLGKFAHQAAVFKLGPRSLMRADAPMERHDDGDIVVLRNAVEAPPATENETKRKRP